MDELLNPVKGEHYQQILNQGKDLALTVHGTSMNPFVRPGEVVIVRQVPWRKIYIGDLVLSYVDHRFNCHRVFQKGRDWVRTKADALVGLDPRISDEQVLGKVIYRKINGRILRTDTFSARIKGVIIGWCTYCVAPLYWALRRLGASL